MTYHVLDSSALSPSTTNLCLISFIKVYMKKKSSGESSRARSTKERSTSLRELVLDTNCFFKSDIQSPTHPEPELCESPISRFCEGWCNHSLYPEEKGHVVRSG